MKNNHKPTRTCSACNGTGREQDDAAIGAQMQARRERAGLTLREVGKRIDYSIGYVSDLEHGRKRWSEELQAAYEDATNLHQH